MLGTPVTYLPKFAEGTNGFIVVCDLDDLFINAIDFVQFGIDGDTTATLNVEEGVDLKTLNSYLESATAPNAAWAKSSSLLYLFFNTSVYSYLNTNIFVVYGTRSGIPITNLDDNIDVPEQHLELYTKYVIREAAELQGKLVPPSIKKDIEELENKLR
jgi:hypothetical protein